jgi:hypothetical protein
MLYGSALTLLSGTATMRYCELCALVYVELLLLLLLVYSMKAQYSVRYTILYRHTSDLPTDTLSWLATCYTEPVTAT